MIKYDYEAGIKAIKQSIIPSLLRRNCINNLKKYTFSLLARTCDGWMSS